MAQIRTLNLTNKISNTYGQLLIARSTGDISMYDQLMYKYQNLLKEFIDITERKNEVMMKENEIIRREAEKSNIELTELLKYHRYSVCLSVVR